MSITGLCPDYWQLFSLSFPPFQETLKPQYLEQLPGQLKQFSLFLGKFSWFAGEKVGRKEREKMPFYLPSVNELSRTDHLIVSLAHFCGFPHLWCLGSEPYVWAQVPGWISKLEGFHVPFWGDAPCTFPLQKHSQAPLVPTGPHCHRFLTPAFA